MKQLSAIFLVLAMVLALTACGETERSDDSGQTRPGTSQTRPGTSQSRDAQQDDGGVQDDARMGRGVLRRGAERTATFRQMLENGYVHDSDGFLNDGENTSW